MRDRFGRGDRRSGRGLIALEPFEGVRLLPSLSLSLSLSFSLCLCVPCPVMGAGGKGWGD